MEATEENVMEKPTEQKGEVWNSWANPVATQERWLEVRRAVEAGMTQIEASQVFRLSYEAIKKRAQREEWITDGKIKSLIIEKKASPEIVPQGENGQEKAPLAPLPPQNALEAVAASLEGYRSRTLLKLAKLAEKGVEKAIDANLNIENWQDAKIAAELALKLHAPQALNSVQVNVLTDGSASFDVEDFPVIEAEES